MEAFKCFVAWVAGTVKFAGGSVEQCRVSLHLRPRRVSLFPCKIILTIVIGIMILDFKYFIKTYFITVPFPFFFFPQSLNWILSRPSVSFPSLSRIYRTYIISRCTDNNAGTLIFQHPESIVHVSISKCVFLFFEFPFNSAQKYFSSPFFFFFSPLPLIVPFVMLTSSIA